MNLFIFDKKFNLSVDIMAKLKMAVICSSNMNRSMEAHSVFAKRDFQVSSYGTGDKVKIPGKHPRGIFFSKIMLPENCLGRC